MLAVWKTGEGNVKLFLENMPSVGYSLYYAGLDHQEPGEEGVSVESSYRECLFV